MIFEPLDTEVKGPLLCCFLAFIQAGSQPYRSVLSSTGSGFGSKVSADIRRRKLKQEVAEPEPAEHGWLVRSTRSFPMLRRRTVLIY